MCAAAEPCLRLHFLNVGDGDAILAEEEREQGTFRLLVDTGRPEVGSCPGSLRCTAGEHLRRRGISFVDALVITHLHEDHFGGLATLLPRVRFGDVYAGFFPARTEARIPEAPGRVRTVEKLVDCLNRWAALCGSLTASGSRLHLLDRNLNLAFTDRLQGTIFCPGEEAAGFQRMAWAGMLAGEDVPAWMQYWSAKYRNPGSARVLLTYAGRTVLLAGDCYGAAWEEQAEPCDICKVPHHGDRKALTPRLAARLRPAWAVISCGAEYNPQKDRPSRDTAALLLAQGTRLYFTDCFAAPWHPPDRWASVDLTISQSGEIVSPGRQV